MASEGYIDVQVRNVPKDLLKDFDAAIKGEYSTRAEAIRALMRRFIHEKKERQNLRRVQEA